MTTSDPLRDGAVAVAVISYNTRDILHDCLASVVADAPDAVVVVDNGSTDGSIEMVQQEFPAVRLLLAPDNPGYGAASNLAVAACDVGYVLLLNSDIVLRRGTLRALRDYMERHPRAGMAGPRLINADGSLQPSCYAFPSAAFIVVKHSTLELLARRVPAIRRRFFIDWPHDEARVVPWASGAALMLRRAAFDEVRGFDPSFHMYAEEVDLAYRMAAAGWETHFAPVADVVHLGGASTAKVWRPMRVRYFRSLVQFCATHHSMAATKRAIAALRALVLVKLAQDLVRLAVVRDPELRRGLQERTGLWKEILRVPFLREACEVRARSQ